jgi:RHS repeat-associated protein
MKTEENLILSPSTSHRLTKKTRKVMSLTLRQRLSYGKPRRHNTGKELDSETGLYYFGARYLDPKTGRWISGDPALGEYVPGSGQGPDKLSGMGGVFNYVNLHIYHYAGNNPVRYIDPNGRDAWEHTSEWDYEKIDSYRQFVVEQIERYETSGQRFTCEDLALSLFIDFASQNGLPVKITNNSGESRAEKTYSSKGSSFNSVEDFRTAVLATTGADDLMKSANTVRSSHYLTGDLLLLDRGSSSVPLDGIINHTQVITGVSEGSLSIAQGNLSGSGNANPNSRRYIGVPIQRGEYNLRDDSYTRDSNRTENAMQTFVPYTRRWNFFGMN